MLKNRGSILSDNHQGCVNADWNACHCSTGVDVGCGCGAFSELCNKEFPGLKYVGIDYAEEAIEIAKEQWKGVNFMVKDYKELDKEFIQNINEKLIFGLIEKS